MEKQLVIRSVGQNVPYFAISAGRVIDGQFVPSIDSVDEFERIFELPSGTELPSGIIRRDDLFDNNPVIARKDVNRLMCLYYHGVGCLGAEFYEGLIVLKFQSDEIEKETSKEE